MNTSQIIINEVAYYLNDYIAQHGEISINNKHIWNKWLHKWDNTKWDGILAEFAEVMNNPNLEEYHRNAIVDATIAFMQTQQQNKRCMDMKQNKKYAWQLLMMMRELNPLINPEVKTPAIKKPKVTTEFFEDRVVTTVFFNLFEEE